MESASLIQSLEKLLGVEAVTSAADELLVYECDGHTIERALPTAVVFPTTAEQIAEVVRLCHRLRVPFLARGAGTGLSGGALPVEGGVLIEMARMNRVLEIDEVNQVAVVEPGLVNLRLSQAVQGMGLYYAPDPSSQAACTLGGNAAENSGGPHTLKYGVTTNHVLGLEMVLPNGETITCGSRAGRGPGYDLTGLLVGSEGTFGIITKIIVRLTRLPEAYKTLAAVFPSIDAASSTVTEIIGAGIIPAALEMIDHFVLRAVEAYLHLGFPAAAGAVLLIELDGIRDGLDELAERIEAICRQNGSLEVRVAKDDAERALLWKARKEAFGALGRVTRSFYTHDGVIPRTKLPEALRRIYAIVEKHGLGIANVFHAGDGNLHPLVLFDDRKPGDQERALKAGEEILRVCVDLGGSLSGEHGIGLEKREWMPWFFTDQDLELMQRVRSVFNPEGLCNPGKVFPTPGRCVETRPFAKAPNVSA
ncbi:MAG: FAD-binding protein [Candidatus Tectomicrobia bacterium]|nr:FAD-binding protein [Candidatus Tectomicrobia bacterium]